MLKNNNRFHIIQDGVVMIVVVYSGTESEATTAEQLVDYHHVCEAFAAALALGPCILVIDGIDELVGSYGQTPQQVSISFVFPIF